MMCSGHGFGHGRIVRRVTILPSSMPDFQAGAPAPSPHWDMTSLPAALPQPRAGVEARGRRRPIGCRSGASVAAWRDHPQVAPHFGQAALGLERGASAVLGTSESIAMDVQQSPACYRGDAGSGMRAARARSRGRRRACSTARRSSRCDRCVRSRGSHRSRPIASCTCGLSHSLPVLALGVLACKVNERVDAGARQAGDHCSLVWKQWRQETNLKSNVLRFLHGVLRRSKDLLPTRQPSLSRKMPCID